jgi:hypothetical protein
LNQQLSQGFDFVRSAKTAPFLPASRFSDAVKNSALLLKKTD